MADNTGKMKKNNRYNFIFTTSFDPEAMKNCDKILEQWKLPNWDEILQRRKST